MRWSCLRVLTSDMVSASWSICFPRLYVIGSIRSLLQAALVDFSAVQSIAQAGSTTIERLCAIFKQYPDRTCFGIPATTKPEWKSVTYKDVWERIQVSDCNLAHLRMEIQ